MAVALFAVSDGIVKLLTERYPTGQILFCRGVLAVLLLGLLQQLRQPGRLRLPVTDRAAWLRSACELGAALCFFRALRELPLAEATAVLFVFPVLLTALAVPVLGERIGARRWLAIAAGLGGVLVILRPATAAFDPVALWALAAAGFIAGRDLATRFLRSNAGTEAVALMTTLVTTTASLATLPFGWVALEPAGALGFAASAVLVSSAFLCLVAGTRTGDVSFTAPFRYASVPVSFLIGFLIWGTVPDAWVLLGSVVVAAAGLTIIAPSAKRGVG